MNKRREFIRNTAIGTLAAMSVPQIVSAAFAEDLPAKIRLNKNDVVLFQGDSITDSGRLKNQKEANSASSLGNGYALLAAADILNRYPAENLAIYNRGISGNKVYQLAERWDADCFDLKPNVLSILIGVNDFWHTLSSNYKGTIKTYQDDLTALLDKTMQKLPDVKLIMGEPFAITGVKAVDSQWFPAFYDYQKTARDIAEKYKAAFIPYQNIFDKAIKIAPAPYWTADGVHPTLAGSRLMAQAWLEIMK